jgi:uncharacterized protein (TIRG00374 family)
MPLSSRSLNAIAFVCGVALLGLFVWSSGPEALWDSMLSVGTGMAWICLIFLAEVLLEVLAWQLAVPRGDRTSYVAMFCASVAGSSLNNLLPTGQAGEVVKGNLLAGLVPGPRIVSSLVVYNWLFNLTTVAFVGVASLACLLADEVSLEVGLGLIAGTGASGILMTLVFLWIRRGAVGDVIAAGRKIPLLGRRVPASAGETARKIDEEIRTFRAQRPRDYWKSVWLLVAARALAVLELWVILLLLGADLSLWAGTALFCAGQLFYYVALFLPTRLGVLEGGAMALFKLFGFSSELGLAAEFTRTVRKAIFTLLGVALMGYLAIFRRRSQTRRNPGTGP